VRNQGALEIPSDEAFTVSRAILRAGGFADFANRKAVKLTRKNGDTLTVDVVKVLEKGQIDKDIELSRTTLSASRNDSLIFKQLRITSASWPLQLRLQPRTFPRGG
jgi:protein involved in polysaccharide export with SLBB domain